MDELFEVMKIWLYPDNLMSKMTIGLFLGIIVLIVYVSVKHSLISAIVQEFKSEDSEERIYTNVEEFKVVDVIHEIGSCLAFVNSSENLIGLTTETGVDAQEVYYFMYDFWLSGKDFLQEYSVNQQSYNIIGGIIKIEKNGNILVKSRFGNFYSDVREITQFVNNPYKFESIAVKLNLI